MGPAHLALRPQGADGAGGILHDRRLGVPEPVDRLLAVSDDEHRGGHRGVVDQAEPLAPRPHQQRHELPLGPAGVLELVDEHVVIARLEPVSALGELVHAAQQIQGARQHLGEVEHRAGGQLPLVLGHRDREHALHPPREHHVQIAVERGQRLRHRGRNGPRHGAVPPPRRGGPALLGPERREPPARPSRRGQKVLADPVEQGTQPVRLRLGSRGEAGELAREGPEPGMGGRAVREKTIETAVDTGQEPASRSAACRHAPSPVNPRGPVMRNRWSAAGATSRRSSRWASAVRTPARPQAGQHHRHREVVGGHRAADREGSVQGLLDQPGHLGLVGHPEPGVEVRLEGKLAQQGQAERIDGADGDLAQPVTQRPPAVPFGPAARPPRAGARG